MRWCLCHIVLFLTGIVSCSVPRPEPESALSGNPGYMRVLLALERTCAAQGLYPSALRTIERGEKMAEEAGDPGMAALFRFDRGYVLVKSGQAEEGFAWMQEGIEAVSSIPGSLSLTSCLGLLADAYEGEGRYGEAIDVCVRRLDLLTQLYEQERDREELDRQFSHASKKLARLLVVTGEIEPAPAPASGSAGWVEEEVLSQSARFLSLHHLHQKNAEVGWKEREARRNLLFAASLFFLLLLATILLVRVVRDARHLLQKNRQLVWNLEKLNQYRQEVARLKEEAADSDEWKRSAQQVTDAELLGRLDMLMEQKELYRNSELNLKMIARALSVPQSRVESLFRNLPDAEGLSDYLNRKRLLYACRMLKDAPYLKVAAICESAGFTSLSVFQRYFKKEMGMTAAEYRAAVRE